ncbi:hypothetical protein SDC9_58036 [bioreactor metagenome]|uniref:Condensation domain-containing protein n=1 Tax=bioreactor metagenome TaxID=1076179 RepID=A0A644X696_9ZZZZ
MQQSLLTERTHLFCPCIKVAVLVDIEGPVDLAMLDAAIGQAVAANEIVCSTIGLDLDGKACYRPTGKPLYSLSLSAEPWEVLVASAHRRPSNLEEGPLLECFAQQLDAALQLVLVAHHLAGDGLSMAFLMQDIMRSLAGEPVVFKPLKLLCPSTIGDSSSLNPVMRFVLERQNSSWRKTGKAFTYSDYNRMVQAYWENRRIFIAHRRMEGESFAKLLQFAKKGNITLNSVLCTAMFKVKGGKVMLGLAVSVRPEGEQAMGNFASGISVQYRYNSSKDLALNAQAVQKRIRKKTQSDDSRLFLLRFLQAIDQTLIDAAYFAAYDEYDNPIARRMQAMFGYEGSPAQIGISNLLRLPIQELYGDYRLARFSFIPPLVPNNASIMGVATLGSAMELSLIGSSEDTQTVLDRMVQELENLVE